MLIKSTSEGHFCPRAKDIFLPKQVLHKSFLSYLKPVSPSWLLPAIYCSCFSLHCCWQAAFTQQQLQAYNSGALMMWHNTCSLFLVTAVLNHPILLVVLRLSSSQCVWYLEQSTKEQSLDECNLLSINMVLNFSLHLAIFFTFM